VQFVFRMVPNGGSGVMNYVRSDTPSYLLITCLFFLLLAGRYSIARLANPSGDTGFENVSFRAEEVRNVGVVLFVALLLVSASCGRRYGPHLRPLLNWTLWVVLLDVYLACGAWWVRDLDEMVLYRAAELILLAMLQISYVWVFSSAPEQALKFLMILCFAAALVYASAGMSGHWHLDQRAEAFGGGPNIFIRVVGTGIFAALYLWGKTGKPLWVCPCPLLAVAAVLSGSRGGMLGLSIAIPVCFTSLFRRARGIWIAFAILAAVSATVLASPSLSAHLFQFWQTRYVDLTFEREYTSSRDKVFGYAWTLFCAHPLAGVGLNGFTQATGYIYPHNLVLNVACEGGLIGLVLLVIPVSIIIRRLFTNNTLEQKVCLSLGIFYFVANMFSGTYYDARFMWLFLLLFLAPASNTGSGHFERPPAVLRSSAPDGAY
jgi:O-antigen ligase